MIKSKSKKNAAKLYHGAISNLKLAVLIKPGTSASGGWAYLILTANKKAARENSRTAFLKLVGFCTPAVAAYIFLKTIEPFVPPKPKELDMAHLTSPFRATFGI